MRVTVDATPLLGRRTGVGTYTARLLAALAADGAQDDIVATAFTWRGSASLADAVPEGVRSRSRRVPARLLRAAWTNLGGPPVELMSGPADVFHATNFVLPPLSHAAGVLTVHDLAYLRFPDTVAPASLAYRELVPAGIARAAVVLTPTQVVADQLRDAYRVDPDRVRVTHLGVDPSWARSAAPTPAWLQRRGIPERYLLAVGTLEPRKNLSSLVAAYARICRQPDVPALVLAGGEGWGARIDGVGIPSDRLVLTGHVPQEDLQHLVAGAALLVFPSLDEGFGLPPLEALACGVPVLANDLPVLREVLGDQATLCDARDDTALAAGILDALVRPVGTPGSRRAHAAAFTWSACAAATRDAYLAALGG